MRVAAAQLRPVWLDRTETTKKVVSYIEEAANSGVDAMVFSETFLCGYPFWMCRTNGAANDDPQQKEAYARYLEAAVEADSAELREIAQAAGDHGVFVFLGFTERGERAARNSTFCALAAIDPERGLVCIHRKLAPTYDERLVWARGDGHGLRAHPFGATRMSGLCCWENWMPQARNALYADGAEVHFAVWPGWSGLTPDITRFIAMEGRVFSVAASGLLSYDDVPEDFPMLEEMRESFPKLPFDGGSCIAGPDGQWLVPPVVGEERLVIADIDPHRVRQERLMFDPAGHYSRPDVFHTVVSRERQEAALFVDSPHGESGQLVAGEVDGERRLAKSA
jgi:nitrilase